LDQIQDRNAFNTTARYGISKLANILFTRELHRRYGDKVFCNALHPGAVQTELGRGLMDYLGFLGKIVMPIAQIPTYFVLLSALQGALTSLYLATSPDVVQQGIKNKYYVPFAKVGELSKQAQDDEMAKNLWDMTEKLVTEKLSK
jgi:NAD(P)-dependent dehydrogenase (short-subunit alcohol dehydrogenase family)